MPAATPRRRIRKTFVVGGLVASIALIAMVTGSVVTGFVIHAHTLESTGGLAYAEMPRFVDENGSPTNDEAAAAVDPGSGRPAENPLRRLWVTSTALTTALDTAYFAESVSTSRSSWASRCCSPASASSCSRSARSAGRRSRRQPWRAGR